MKWPIFSYSKVLLKQDLKLYGVLSALFGAMLGLENILKILTQYQQNKSFPQVNAMNHLIIFPNAIDVILAFGIPILTAMVLFRYLQEVSATAFYHSLPIKRRHIMGSHLIAGLILLLAPVLIATFASVSTMFLISELTGKVTIELLKWALAFGVTEIMVFGTAVLAGMLVGSTVFQAVLTALLIILPAGLVLGGSELLNQLLFGYPYAYDHSGKWANLSPLFAVKSFQSSRTYSLTVVQFLIYGIVTTIGAIILYQLRDLERNHDWISFARIRGFFVVIMTFLCMITGGIYIQNISESMGMKMLALFLGAMIGYVVSQMIVHKSLNILKTYKGFIVYCVIAILIMGTIKMDFIGYEHKLPKVDEITSIKLSQSLIYPEGYFNDFVDEDQMNDYGDTFFYKKGESKNPIDHIPLESGAVGLITYAHLNKEVYTSPQAVNALLRLHFLKIQDRSEAKKGLPVTMQYQLKNGSKLARGFLFDQNIKSEEIGDLFNCEEFKKKNNPILYIEPSKIRKVSIYTLMGTTLVKSDPESIDKMLSAIQADVMDETYDEQRHDGYSAFYIDVSYYFLDGKGKKVEQYLSVPIYKSYTRLLDVMGTLKLKNQVIPTSDNVKSIAVIKVEKNKMGQIITNISDYYSEEGYASLKLIEDSESIWQILNHYSGSDTNETSYQVFMKIQVEPEGSPLITSYSLPLNELSETLKARVNMPPKIEN